MKRVTGALRVVVLFITAMALALGCRDSRELSRPKAAAILRDSPVFKASVNDEVAINSEAFELGVAWGAWDAKGNTAPEIRDQILEASRSKLRVAPPISTELGEITGISDVPLAGGVVKSVDFTWRFVGLSPLLKAFASAPGPSSVEMQLYDDGWRLSGGLEITTSGRFSLTDPESSELAAVLTKISDRRSAEARALEERRAELARLISESKKPTATLGICHYVSEYGAAYQQGKTAPGLIRISDVGFELSGERIEGPPEPSEYYYFDIWRRNRLHRSCQWDAISSASYHSATWMYDSEVILFGCDMDADYRTVFTFETKMARDACLVLLDRSLMTWKTNYLSALQVAEGAV